MHSTAVSGGSRKQKRQAFGAITATAIVSASIAAACGGRSTTTAVAARPRVACAPATAAIEDATTDASYPECAEFPGWWPKACYEGVRAASLFPDGRLWAPPPSCSDEDYRDAASWATSGPPPTGLRFLLLRGLGPSYVVNIFADGRALYQSLACGDRHIHAVQLSDYQMQFLSDAFVPQTFLQGVDCDGFITDSSIVVVGWSNGRTTKVHYSTSSTGGSTVELANLIDEIAGTRRWVR
jgi:hypothetical protein